VKKAKFVSKPDLQGKLQREISLMRILDHPHLLKLLDVCETEDKLYLILEYMANGELFDYIVERGSLSAQEALKFFRQIVYGLSFLHGHGICHRDLKPENVLLDAHGNVHIGDFGFARWMQGSVADTGCGSPHYAAPEITRGERYDGRVSDVWSLGVIFYTFLCGQRPFEDRDVRMLVKKIRTADYEMPDFPDAVKDLISQMLCVDVDQRITIERIKEHPAFRLLVPPDYHFPEPLPEPYIPGPVDVGALSPQIVEVLRQIGCVDGGASLEAELSCDGRTTTVKTFLMLRRLTFDSLPWGAAERPVVRDLGRHGRHLAFGDPFTDRKIYQSDIDLFQERVVEGIDMRHEQLLAVLQKYLGECGFFWYHPNDMLLLARRQLTDVMLRVTCGENEMLKLTIGLASNDDGAFPQFVNTIRSLVFIGSSSSARQ